MNWELVMERPKVSSVVMVVFREGGVPSHGTHMHPTQLPSPCFHNANIDSPPFSYRRLSLNSYRQTDLLLAISPSIDEMFPNDLPRLPLGDQSLERASSSDPLSIRQGMECRKLTMKVVVVPGTEGSKTPANGTEDVQAPEPSKPLRLFCSHQSLPAAFPWDPELPIKGKRRTALLPLSYTAADLVRYTIARFAIIPSGEQPRQTRARVFIQSCVSELNTEKRFGEEVLFGNLMHMLAQAVDEYFFLGALTRPLLGAHPHSPYYVCLNLERWSSTSQGRKRHGDTTPKYDDFTRRVANRVNLYVGAVDPVEGLLPFTKWETFRALIHELAHCFLNSYVCRGSDCIRNIPSTIGLSGHGSAFLALFIPMCMVLISWDLRDPRGEPVDFYKDWTQNERREDEAYELLAREGVTRECGTRFDWYFPRRLGGFWRMASSETDGEGGELSDVEDSIDIEDPVEEEDSVVEEDSVDGEDSVE